MSKSHFILWLVALHTTALVGCDSSDEETRDPVLGVWESFGDPIYFLDVSEEELLLHLYYEDFPDVGECFGTITYEVLSRAGNRWEVRQVTTDNTATFVVEYDAGDLVVTLITPLSTTGRRFSPSDQTVFAPDCLGD